MKRIMTKTAFAIGIKYTSQVESAIFVLYALAWALYIVLNSGL